MDTERVTTGIKRIFQGVQILFVVFGARVIAPLLTGLDRMLATGGTTTASSSGF